MIKQWNSSENIKPIEINTHKKSEKLHALLISVLNIIKRVHCPCGMKNVSRAIFREITCGAESFSRN
jgi:hypothetical protein